MAACSRLFYLKNIPLVGEQFVIEEPEELRHIFVMRVKEGDVIELTDGKGRGALCRLLTVCKDTIIAEVAEDQIAPRYPLKISLAFAVTKRTKWEWLIEKGRKWAYGVSYLWSQGETGSFQKESLKNRCVLQK